MRWLVRTVATIVGLVALVGTSWLVKRYGLENPKRARFEEGVAASQAVRSEVGRDCTLSVDLAPDSDSDVIVKVSFRDVPDDLEVRREVMRGTNQAVRRHVHRVRDLKVFFDDAPENLPSWDGGLAVASAPLPIGMEAPVRGPEPQAPDAGRAPAPASAPASKGGGKKGAVTLVTFPEADVLKGRERLGRTPLFNVELPVGTHLLTLVGDDGSRYRLSMPVKAGKNKPLKLNLSDLPSR